MFKQRIFLFLLCLALFTLSACSTFVPEEDVDSLNKRYSGNYVLLQDFVINELTLAKGTVVRLIIVGGDEWIKVYAYKADEDLLNANRFLILYMFEDEFPDKEFNADLLDKELAAIVKPLNSELSEADKLQQKKSDRKK